MTVAYDPGPIPKALDRREIIWSFTMLNTYRNICAYQTYRRYIAKDIPFVETEAMRKGTEVHKAMELRISGDKPLPEKLHIYEPFAQAFKGRTAKCEMQLGITKEGKATGFFDKDVWGRGKADVVLVQGDKAYILDWKVVGKPRDEPFELEIHGMLLKAKYPELKTIKGQYAFLQQGYLGVLHDISETLPTWNNVCHLMKLIENDRQRGVFEKEPGPLCGWCDCMDCEHNKKSRC